ncbi:uncharacterized protein [Rutidosis leptorrhynchoides]|uniref:uncharacterized protein n=1 Tax=Rutidosis leptorrhynchoides TaxID=125765 RepID=UPI003A99BD87
MTGQVENTNLALKQILEKTVNNNPKVWQTKLDDALWAFRIAFKTPIGTTPFKLVYGKAYHIPMEVEYRAFWALKQVNLDLEQAGEKRAMFKFSPSKLRSRWTGPYVVKRDFPSGYVELIGNGKIFKVNGHRLKIYNDEVNALVIADITLYLK